MDSVKTIQFYYGDHIYYGGHISAAILAAFLNCIFFPSLYIAKMCSHQKVASTYKQFLISFLFAAG